MIEYWLGAFDKKLPYRFYKLEFQERLLKGTLYEALPHDMFQDLDSSGNYIALRKRRPQAPKNLSKVVVNDSVSMLFGEGHFPSVQHKDKKFQTALGDLMEEYRLQQRMIKIAKMGAVGSVAVEIAVVEGKLVLLPHKTKCMYPEFSEEDPTKLVAIEQRLMVASKELPAYGHKEPTDSEGRASTYWLVTRWDDVARTEYKPIPTTEDVMAKRKVHGEPDNHGLGEVPIVWIRNLPDMDEYQCGPDGEPTVPYDAAALAIEADFQGSQSGRALAYSSDPVTVITKGAEEFDDEGTLDQLSDPTRRAANVIEIEHGGKAEMLEISGEGANATREYVRDIREGFMELARGNRTSPDKLAAATSGYAIELMNMALINLVKDLRLSYGEEGLLRILELIVRISDKVVLEVGGKRFSAKPHKQSPLRLRWPPFYEQNANDRQMQAATLAQLTSASLLPLDTAREQAAVANGIVQQDALDELPKAGYLPLVSANPAPPAAENHVSKDPNGQQLPKPKK